MLIYANFCVEMTQIKAFYYFQYNNNKIRERKWLEYSEGTRSGG